MDEPYRLSPLAEADLEEIWLYTLRHWSVEQAGSCLRNLVETVEGLAKSTKQGQQAGAQYQPMLAGKAGPVPVPLP